MTFEAWLREVEERWESFIDIEDDERRYFELADWAALYGPALIRALRRRQEALEKGRKKAANAIGFMAALHRMGGVPDDLKPAFRDAFDLLQMLSRDAEATLRDVGGAGE